MRPPPLLALLLDLGLVGLAAFKIVVHVHMHDLFGGEFRAAVLAEKADGVRAALPAMPHHVHFAFALILQRLQLLRRWAALTGEPEYGAMLRRGNKRHDVVQEGAPGLHGPVYLDKVLVIDSGDHDRVDFAENAALCQHF